MTPGLISSTLGGITIDSISPSPTPSIPVIGEPLMSGGMITSLSSPSLPVIVELPSSSWSNVNPELPFSIEAIMIPKSLSVTPKVVALL